MNDLWTDPQIHSVSGEDYGDGNLGIRGMALFLLSHKYLLSDYFRYYFSFRCNDICEYLKLPEFELYETEKEAQCREEIEKSLTNLTRIQTEVPVSWF